MTQQKKSPVKTFFKCVGIVLMITVLYYTRSFWPLVFVGEPIATIHATIPPDKQLHIGMGLESYNCKFVTASSGSLINSRRTWTKQYSPDAEGKVTVNVYPRSLSFCDWEMTGFSVSLKNNAVPSYIYDIDFIPSDVKENIAQYYENYDFSESYARTTFKLVDQLNEKKSIENVSLNYTIAPYLSKIKNKFGEYIYLFNYSSTRTQGKSEYDFYLFNSLKIDYVVSENKNNVIFEEVDRINKTKFENTIERGRQQLSYP